VKDNQYWNANARHCDIASAGPPLQSTQSAIAHLGIGNGLRLVTGEEVYFEWVGNLGVLFVDAAVSGGGGGGVSLAV
jgi:hypothetical protein